MDRRGFTLVELLMVMAIVGIVTAVDQDDCAADFPFMQ